jgi:hypothetical protein
MRIYVCVHHDEGFYRAGHATHHEHPDSTCGDSNGDSNGDDSNGDRKGGGGDSNGVGGSGENGDPDEDACAAGCREDNSRGNDGNDGKGKLE